MCALPYDVDDPPRGHNDTWTTLERPYCREEFATWPGNIAADPRFVEPDADDYRLGADSPCSDAGIPDDEFRDFDGSRNDIGAFGGPMGDWTPLPDDGGP